MHKRIGIYLRVSTSSQSTDLQRGEIISFLMARGWTNWQVYEDVQSGTDSTRPALNYMLSDARQRRVDCIICWKLDRLFRSLKGLVSTLQELNEIGVEFISLKDNIDLTTASGRLLMHMISAFGEFEVALIRERVKAGVASARRNGKTLGRPRIVRDAEILGLRKSGLTLAAIAQRTGVSKSSVHKSLKNQRRQNLEITGPKLPVLTVHKSDVLCTSTKDQAGVNHD